MKARRYLLRLYRFRCGFDRGRGGDRSGIAICRSASSGRCSSARLLYIAGRRRADRDGAVAHDRSERAAGVGICAARAERGCRDHLARRGGGSYLGTVGAAARAIANFFRGLARRLVAARLQQDSSAFPDSVYPDHRSPASRSESRRRCCRSRKSRNSPISGRCSRSCWYAWVYGFCATSIPTGMHRPFRTPLVPLVPILGVIFCLYLMAQSAGGDLDPVFCLDGGRASDLFQLRTLPQPCRPPPPSDRSLNRRMIKRRLFVLMVGGLLWLLLPTAAAMRRASRFVFLAAVPADFSVIALLCRRSSGARHLVPAASCRGLLSHFGLAIGTHLRPDACS